MCAICGCSGDHHAADPDHHHHHDHDGQGKHGQHGQHEPAGRSAPLVAFDRRRSTIAIERDVLAHNDGVAQENRRWFHERKVFALNLLSSPGAGKTTLLERMIRERTGGQPIAVIEGDQETDRDAQRIRGAGARAVQVNTGAGCHLDAAMVARAAKELDPPVDTLLAIENVGNLVCPALFDLGEEAKLVVASVTEGEDKPIKYPHAFRAAEAVVLNKTDLLPHVRYDVDRFVAHVHEVNPRADVVLVSAALGDGFVSLDRWLRSRIHRSGGTT